MKPLYQLITFFLLCIPVIVDATHIVGGYLSYECLGSENYRFTLNMYRNCNSQSNDFFANPAPITIFRGNVGPYVTISNRQVPLDGLPQEVPLIDNPCIILPPDICVEEGTYTFEINLPISSESYHVTYQRCCRNASISNIDEPDRLGATFTIELLPAAQLVCNSSPVYNEYPPPVICVNKPIEVDHSATDPDGDVLVYSLCAPFLGAGIKGAWEPGDPEGCDGFRPDPACPPPYKKVPFILPDYSELEPIPGDPVVGINTSTGQLFGTPDQQGQFAVGLCVSEYRNGILMSVVRRDFQFNITYCEDRVSTGMEGEYITFEEDFYLANACGEKTIEFINTSTIKEFIDEYKWEFFIDGTVVTYSNESVTHTFPDYGIYEGRLILNPNNSLCRDTGLIDIRLFPQPTADFSFSYDTCVAGEVSFVDLSLSPGGNLDLLKYYFGSGQISEEPNPVHLFDRPGLNKVKMEIIDENGCEDEIDQFVNWFPAPAVIIIEPSSFSGCTPLDVFFENLSFPIDSTYTVEWNLGDGESSEEISPSHTYYDIGQYSLSIRVTSPLGCYIEESWDNWITVYPNPIADFSYMPERLTNFAPEVTFQEESFGGEFWEWYINDQDFIYGKEASFVFRDTGLQKVALVVENEFTCRDTAELYIDVIPLITYFLPNAFTPNGDGKNEEFIGVGRFEGLKNFHMMIFNRWGEMIFETDHPEEGWNGLKHNTGKRAPNGVYPFIVNYQEPRGKMHHLQGFATLIR